MNFELPLPGPEALYHPPSMTWTELNRLPNIRPFLGWTTYPFVSYDDWMRRYASGNCPVYDRQPGRPEFEFHGVINDGVHQGGYVSVDAHTIIMAPTRLRPGQYHHHADDREWAYYENPADAPKPRMSFGFYRSVVDFGMEARGQVWDLFLAMREPMKRDDTRPGILIIARKNYEFSIPPGYRPRDVQWTAACECSSLVKVGDYKIPDNGCLEFRDKIAHGIPQSAGHFEVLSGAGDGHDFRSISFQPDLSVVGIYPVEVIKDSEGLVTCVKVRFDGQGDVNLDSPEEGRQNYSFAKPRSQTPQHRADGNSKACGMPESTTRKSRRKSTGDVLDITKGFLKDIRNVARRVV